MQSDVELAQGKHSDAESESFCAAIAENDIHLPALDGGALPLVCCRFRENADTYLILKKGKPNEVLV